MKHGLTPLDVEDLPIKIKSIHDSSDPCATIAKQYSVTVSIVNGIKTGLHSDITGHGSDDGTVELSVVDPAIVIRIAYSIALIDVLAQEYGLSWATVMA